jgi:hypothetical protein
MLTADIARKIWSYDTDTGFFFWKESPKYDVLVGTRAGYFDGKYWRLAYRGKRYKASRVAWLYTTGEWPKDQIDHINGDKLDDRIINLRNATNAQNCKNRNLRSDNTLGVKGVHQTKRGFVAQVVVNGVHVLNKTFGTLEAAQEAYIRTARAAHGEYARV